MFTSPAAMGNGKRTPFDLRLNNLYGYVDANPLAAIDSQALSATLGLGRLLGGAAAGGARGSGAGIAGLIGGAVLGAALSQCQPSAQDRCDRQCDADYDFEQKQCEAWWKTTGRDNSALKVCMDKARKNYLQCYQDCKSEGN